MSQEYIGRYDSKYSYPFAHFKIKFDPSKTKMIKTVFIINPKTRSYMVVLMYDCIQCLMPETDEIISCYFQCLNS